MPVFETPRLDLRPLGPADKALYCRLHTDPEVMRHIAAPLSAEAAQAAFQRVIALNRPSLPSMQVWVLNEREPSTDIGILALIRHAKAPDALEIGAMLLVEGQGRGLAAEAQTALLDWVFATPGIRVVASSHAPGHRAVIGVKQKLGFVRAATGGTDGEDAHGLEVRWQMTRERWDAVRPGRTGKT